MKNRVTGSGTNLSGVGSPLSLANRSTAGESPAIRRLREHFASSVMFNRRFRQVGLEIESLIVDRAGYPISLNVSKKIMETLVMEFGWHTAAVTPMGHIIAVQSRLGTFKYDSGWNLFELNTVPIFVSEIPELWKSIERANFDLRKAADVCDAVVLQSHIDKSNEDTLLLADERDRLFALLDGKALIGMAHIASVHVNVECASPTEAFQWINKLEHLYAKEGWPRQESEEAWRRFLVRSHARYEPDRFGEPPKYFEDYCQRLSKYRVFVDGDNERVNAVVPPQPFEYMQDANIELFLRSVWWLSRLRVRSGRLVLEIRPIPRESDADIKKSVMTVLDVLNIC